MINIIKNIFQDKKLRNKILFTIMILFIYKIGTIITIPTINNLANAGNMGFIENMEYLTGSSITSFTIFALGLTPYITASIIVQLLAMDVIKPLSRWKEEGEAGKKKTDKCTIFLAIILAILESCYLVINFQNNYQILISDNKLMYFLTVLFLVGGACISIYLAHLITKKGIGNGTSLLIFAGIVSHLGYDIIKTATQIIDFSVNDKIGFASIGLFIIYILFFISIIGLIVFFDKSIKKIKIQYSKENELMEKKESYIPIKVTLAGVIPIIFTVSIITGISFIGALLHNEFLLKISNDSTPFGIICYLFLIVFFTLFYSTEMFNAKKVSKNLQKGNVVVLGQLPGEETEKYLNKTIKSMAIVGSIVLCFIALLPMIASTIASNVYQNSLNLTLGGTSIMIIAGVACETIEQINAKLQTIKSSKRKLFED